MASLNERQIRLLLMPVQESRVGKNAKGFSHLQAWDIRRTLTRVFGFTGWSEEIIEETLVSERHTPNGKDGYGSEKFRHTVVYRAKVRLTVYDADGNTLSFWDGSAAGDATNLPSLGDAHDFALKTALSQALKRAAHNLGDQFGLSLYNNGSTLGQVQWSMAYPVVAVDQATAAVPTVVDEPVQADPEDVAVEQQMNTAEATTLPLSAEPSRDLSHIPYADVASAAQSGHHDALGELERRRMNGQHEGFMSRDIARQQMLDMCDRIGWTHDGLATQFVTSFGHKIEEGTEAEFVSAIKLMGGGQ